MVVYGYILAEEKKFTMPVEELCSIINIADGLAPDVYVYTTEEDRDLHYNQNIKNETKLNEDVEFFLKKKLEPEYNLHIYHDYSGTRH